MKMITEHIKTPVVFDADICVIGGSCTGVFAAVQAARLGAKVAIVENNGFFGGIATAGLVSIWHSAFDTEVKQQIIAGLTLEVVERLKRRNAVIISDPPITHNGYVFNPEELKLVLDSLITENKIRPFLHTKFVAASHENGQMNAAIIEDKSGRRAIKAKYFIDATGDGDLIARMNLPFSIYDKLQPPTTIAIFDNFSGIWDNNEPFDLSAEIHDSKKHPNAFKDGFLWCANVVGRLEARMIAGTRMHNADCSDADQLTAAEIECRRQISVMWDIMRTIPGGDKLTLSNLAATIGVRETRHIDCLYQLTKDDILNGNQFPDAIAYGTYAVDIHHSDKPGATMQYLDGTQKYFEPGKPEIKSRWRNESAGITPYYQIPYRSLIPQGAQNILVAGRMIGATQDAAGAIRVMINCNQTGEAAGVAATLALRNNLHVKDVPTSELRQTMQHAGSIIL